MKSRRIITLGLAALMLAGTLALSSCGGDGNENDTGSSDSVQVATPNIDENYYGGENLALLATVKADASYRSDVGPKHINNGYFGGYNDRWAPPDGKKAHYITFTWESDVTFDSVRFGVPELEQYLGRSKSVDFMTSEDGENFTTIKTYEGEIGYECLVKFAEPITTRYFRMNFTPNENKGVNITEVEIYYSDGDAEIKGVDADGFSAVVDNEAGTVTLVSESGVTKLAPSFKLASGAVASPAGEQDFNTPVKYTVTSANGKERKEYTVTVRGFYGDDDLEEKTVVVDAFGATPYANQYKYLKEGLAVFNHFGMNTMTGSGWGSGEEKESQWSLDKNIDADGYIKTLKEAGVTRIVLITKHHDGFCNWDSKYTTHDIANTCYPKDKNGTNEESNPVYDFVMGCVRNDMQFGFYYSPWDRNQALYGCYGYKDVNGDEIEGISYETWKAMPDDEKFKQYYEDKSGYFTDYNDYAFAQLRELCDIVKKCSAEKLFVEMWYDGAKASWTDKTTLPQRYLSSQWRSVVTDYFKDYYPEIMDQLIFQSGIETYEMSTGGNESGKVNDGHWLQANADLDSDGNRLKVSGGPGTYLNYNSAATGVKNGNVWYIYEPDGMMMHEWFGGRLGRELVTRPKDLQRMRDMYLRSIGYGTVLLLNIPMDEHGELEAPVAERTTEFGENVRASYYENDLITKHGAKVTVSGVYENAKSLSPNNMIDGNDDTYWTALTPDASIIVEFPEKVTFDVVNIEEAIQLGQRIDGYEIYFMNDAGEWNMFHNGITIATLRIAQSSPVTASKIKIVLHGMTAKDGETRALPTISAISVHKATEAFEFRAPADVTLSTLDSTSQSITSDFTEVSDEYALGRSYLEGAEGNTFTVKFNGSSASICGQMMSKAVISVSVDGGEAITVENDAAADVMGDSFFDAEGLSASEHTITIKVVSGTVRVDCVYYSSASEIVKAEIEMPETIREEYVTGIEVTNAPAKTEYKVGETLDLTGLKVSTLYAMNPRTKTLYEASGIFEIYKETANTSALKATKESSGRRDVLGGTVFADSIRFTFKEVVSHHTFQKSRVSEIEIYNSKNPDVNLALSAHPDAISGESNWSNYKYINDGSRGDAAWNADWASEYFVWAELNWDEIVEFDTIDIYENVSAANLEAKHNWNDYEVTANVYDIVPIELDADKYTISATTFTEAGEHTVTVTDEFGNTATFTVTVK